MSPASGPWDIFVSFSNSDSRPFLEGLVGSLQQRVLRVFVDWESCQEGEPLAAALCDAIDASRWGVVLWSSTAAASSHVRLELDRMRARHQSGLRVIVVRLETATTAPPDIAECVLERGSGSDGWELSGRIEAIIRKGNRHSQ